MSTFRIDGRTFSGRSINIVNGRVIIDGVVQDGQLSGVVEIRVTEGKIDSLHSDADVTCQDVVGSVHAGMNVTCGNVGGGVRGGMNVTCGDVTGDASAGMGMTQIRRR